MKRRALLSTFTLLGVAGCAALDTPEPLKVGLAGIEPLPGAGLELRMAVKLRLQNPNPVAVDYDGISLDLELRGLDFASGVSDVAGSVPRFGETLVTVPMTVSAVAMARQVFSLAGEDRGRIDYAVRGRLASGPFGGLHFSGSGQFDALAPR